MLDTSALLAFLNGEPGGQNVPIATGEAFMSSVNYAEAVSVMMARGMAAEAIREQMARIVVEILDFGYEAAEYAGLLIAKTKSFGLSLGDRACLAAAADRGLPVLTADKSWATLDLGVEIRMIR